MVDDAGQEGIRAFGVQQDGDTVDYFIKKSPAFFLVAALFIKEEHIIENTLGVVKGVGGVELYFAGMVFSSFRGFMDFFRAFGGKTLQFPDPEYPWAMEVVSLSE